MMGCCDASKTCFRKGAGYGQCKDVCPTNTDWGCYTSPPTVAPTSAPTGAPTYACIFHTATGASANCRLDGIERPCCDTSKKCFAKVRAGACETLTLLQQLNLQSPSPPHSPLPPSLSQTDTYGQCKDVCPSNTDWDCYTAAPSNSPTSSPTSAPTTTCVAEGADCIEGGEAERGAKDDWAEGWSEATVSVISNGLPSCFARNPLTRRFAPRSLRSSQTLTLALVVCLVAATPQGTASEKTRTTASARIPVQSTRIGTAIRNPLLPRLLPLPLPLLLLPPQ